MSAPQPFKCPVCNGTGLVSRPPHVAGDVFVWDDNKTGPYPCKSCLNGIIWGPSGFDVFEYTAVCFHEYPLSFDGQPRHCVKCGKAETEFVISFGPSTSVSGSFTFTVASAVAPPGVSGNTSSSFTLCHEV